MPTASNVRAEKFWPAVPERIWDSIREEFTLPAAAELEAHFQGPGCFRWCVRALVDVLAVRRRLPAFAGGLDPGWLTSEVQLPMQPGFCHARIADLTLPRRRASLY